MPEWLTVISALGGPLAGVLAAIVTVRLQYQKFHTELELQREKLKQEHDRLKAEFATEGSVETAVRHLLELSALPYRSFPMIRHHIGGFDANHLSLITHPRAEL